MYQAMAVEQALITHYTSPCNGTQDVSMPFLHYHPNMGVANSGAHVKVFEYNGGQVDPYVDVPLRQYSSVMLSSRITDVVPSIKVQANMNTLAPQFSPQLDTLVCFWRDDQVARIGQRPRVPNNSSPMELVNLSSIPLGFYHAYHVDTLELYTSYNSKVAIAAEFTAPGQNAESLIRRIGKWQNTDHSLSLLSNITGITLSLYFCANPDTVQQLHSSLTASKYRRALLVDEQLGTTTECPTLGAAERIIKSEIGRAHV